MVTVFGLNAKFLISTSTVFGAAVATVVVVPAASVVEVSCCVAGCVVVVNCVAAVSEDGYETHPLDRTTASTRIGTNFIFIFML